MTNPRLAVPEDPALEQFSTPRQWEVLTAYWREGTTVKAATALGISKQRVSDVINQVRRCAARRGYVPGSRVWEGAETVPPGFALKGQSALVDADGSLLKRWDKTKQEGLAPEEAASLPDPKLVTKLSTMTDAEGRVIAQWRSERPADLARERAWEALAERLAADLPRLAPSPEPTVENEDLCAVYNVGDHHTGMYAWAEEAGDDYDLQLAEKLLFGAVEALSGFLPAAGTSLVNVLGDFFHYDSLEPMTPTNKNLLDSDGRFAKMVDVGLALIRGTIDRARERHGRVHVIVQPGNHDPSTMVFMARCLAALYENEPRVTVDTSPRPFHYFRFGRCLVGVCHGHEPRRLEDLPLIMATDRPEDWGETRHRVWFTGHVHKDRVIDVQGVRVESCRVLASTDAWSYTKYRAARDMKGIVLHREHGEVQRVTVNPNMLA